MDLLKRDYTVKTEDNDNQARGFTGIALQGWKARVFGPKLDGQARLVTTRLTWRCLMVQSLCSSRSLQNTQTIGRLFRPSPGCHRWIEEREVKDGPGPLKQASSMADYSRGREAKLNGKL